MPIDLKKGLVIFKTKEGAILRIVSVLGLFEQHRFKERIIILTHQYYLNIDHSVL
jgi:hypothetical protein